jgi:hypothetical protein
MLSPLADNPGCDGGLLGKVVDVGLGGRDCVEALLCRSECALTGNSKQPLNSRSTRFVLEGKDCMRL